MATPLPADFWPWYDHFLTNSTRVQEMRTFLLRHVKAFSLDEVKSMVSIGPGNGKLDAFIVKECCKSLQHYIAVEPHQPSLDNLSSTMEQFPHLQGPGGATFHLEPDQPIRALEALAEGTLNAPLWAVGLETQSYVHVTLVSEGLPCWAGPPDQVDLVMVNHVLYFVPDRMATVSQLYSWVRPGGTLLIFHYCREHAFSEIGKSVIPSLPKLYDFDDLKEEMVQEGFHIDEESKIPYQIAYKSLGDDNMLRLYFKHTLVDVSNEDVERCIGVMRERYDGTGENLQCLDGCVAMKKPKET